MQTDHGLRASAADRTLEAIVARPAMPEDAEDLVDIVDQASDGLAMTIWAGMAEPGETPRDVGLRRARRGDGSFSWCNATLLCCPWPGDCGDDVLAGLIGMPLADEPEAVDEAELPELVRPLVALEAMAAGTWYVNVLAVRPSWRGRGLGARLLSGADDKAAETGRRGVSLIVSSANLRGRSFYRREGFREVAMLPMVKTGWDGAGTHWILCRRD